jgi:hypothetical protein
METVTLCDLRQNWPEVEKRLAVVGDGKSRVFGSFETPAMTAREEELVAVALLGDPEAELVCFHQKRWRELAALVRYAQRDVPVALSQTDPALYRTLREQVTRFYLRGGGAYSLEKLEAMACAQYEAENTDAIRDESDRVG